MSTGLADVLFEDNEIVFRVGVIPDASYTSKSFTVIRSNRIKGLQPRLYASMVIMYL